MFEDTSQEGWNWYVFHEQATDTVRQGHKPEHISGYSDHLELQVLQKPSFASYTGWQIYRRQPIEYHRHPIENNGKARFLGCRTEWLQSEDEQKFSSPLKRLEYLNRLSPSMKFRSLELDPEWIQGTLTRLCSLTLPLFVKSHSIGIDGVSYEVHYGDYMAGTKLIWWGDGPAEWLPLTDAMMSLWTTLETLATNE